MGSTPVKRLFQRASVDAVECSITSVSHGRVHCKFSLAIINHTTRFTVLRPLPNKNTETVVRALLDWVIGTFGPHAMFHSEPGPEFESKVI